MELWLQIVLIVVGCLLVTFIIMSIVFGAGVNKLVFGSRQDKNPKFRYLTAEECSLGTQKLPVSYRGIDLHAVLYTKRPLDECDTVVIFAHGFGAGSCCYMTEINHFAETGNAVVAADAYGCDNSGGKNVLGFYAGAEAVIAAYIAVKSDERLKNKKVALVGHSWGAYSVLCASKKIAVDKVIAISALNSPSQCVCDLVKALSPTGRLLAPVLRPGLWFVNLLKFGAKGNTKAAKAIEKSGVKALLVQGERDATVFYKHSAAAKAKGENVTKLILADKRHNPYNTIEAEDKLAELFARHDDDFYATFEWEKAVEEDAAVMGAIDEFIAS